MFSIRINFYNLFCLISRFIFFVILIFFRDDIICTNIDWCCAIFVLVVLFERIWWSFSVNIIDKLICDDVSSLSVSICILMLLSIVFSYPICLYACSKLLINFDFGGVFNYILLSLSFYFFRYEEIYGVTDLFFDDEDDDEE